jgi:hypothetical protein
VGRWIAVLMIAGCTTPNAATPTAPAQTSVPTPRAIQPEQPVPIVASAPSVPCWTELDAEITLGHGDQAAIALAPGRVELHAPVLSASGHLTLWGDVIGSGRLSDSAWARVTCSVDAVAEYIVTDPTCADTDEFVAFRRHPGDDVRALYAHFIPFEPRPVAMCGTGLRRRCYQAHPRVGILATALEHDAGVQHWGSEGIVRQLANAWADAQSCTSDANGRHEVDVTIEGASIRSVRTDAPSLTECLSQRLPSDSWTVSEGVLHQLGITLDDVPQSCTRCGSSNRPMPDSRRAACFASSRVRNRSSPWTVDGSASRHSCTSISPPEHTASRS